MNTVKILDEIREVQREADDYKVTAVGLLEGLKRVQQIPSEEGISFYDNKWTLIDNKSNRKITFDFEVIHYVYRDIAKGMVFKYRFIDELKVGTVQGKYFTLKKVIDRLVEAKIYDVSHINGRDLEIIFEEMSNESFSYRDRYRRSIIEVIEFIQFNYPQVDYKELIRQISKIRFTQELKTEKEEGKTPNIPQDIFNATIKYAIEDLNNNKLTIEEKRYAAALLLLSQTGIRIGELRELEENKVFSTKIFEEQKGVDYLEYKSPKSNKERSTTFLTEIGRVAYEQLNKAKMGDSKYLFGGGRTKLTSTNTMRDNIMKFYIRHAKELNCLNRRDGEKEGLRSIEVTQDNSIDSFYWSKKLKQGLNIGDVIYYPNPHQFRVAVCSELVKKGINIDWVRKHMNHLEAEMTLGYVRRDEEDKKEKEMAREILKEVIRGDVRLLGKDREPLMDKIEEFINQNNYSVSRDLEKIVEELAGKVPIRQKSSGYCIKSSFGRKCTHDGFNDEIYCAFGICPNHFITYKMINVTYQSFSELKTTIQYNIDAGFKAQATIELNKLRRVVEEALLPELEEIKIEISKRGGVELINKNIELKFYIENVDMLIKEVTDWKNKQVLI